MTPQELDAVQEFIDLALSIIPGRSLSDASTCPCHWCHLRRNHARLKLVVPGVK